MRIFYALLLICSVFCYGNNVNNNASSAPANLDSSTSSAPSIHSSSAPARAMANHDSLLKEPAGQNHEYQNQKEQQHEQGRLNQQQQQRDQKQNQQNRQQSAGGGEEDKASLSKKDGLYSDYEISYYKYFLVMGVMFALLLVLYVIRLRQGRGAQASNISIEQSRILDSKNRIVVIKYEDKKYILGLNPHGVMLIDRIDSKNGDFLDLMKSADNESGDTKV